ncbi:MAG: hypothetical protein ACJA2Q_000526 [Pseudohongiellaceae bacterium]|jgi:hypothetical protein
MLFIKYRFLRKSFLEIQQINTLEGNSQRRWALASPDTAQYLCSVHMLDIEGRRRFLAVFTHAALALAKINAVFSVPDRNLSIALFEYILRIC